MNTFSKQMRNKFIIMEELNYKKYEEHIINMYKEMGAWRHDLRNHVNVVLGLLELDEKDKVIEYISEVESRTDKFESCVYTNNIVLDSLLSKKINISKEKNINKSLKVKINSEIQILNIDICTIIGNLIDNSIEACDKFNGYKFIDIIIISENEQLIIRTKNSCDKKPMRDWLVYTISNISKKFNVVSSASNGKEGYDLAIKLRPQVIISDIKMPIMDGFEFIKEKNNSKYICNTTYKLFKVFICSKSNKIWGL